ncbi:MAG: hypothetical protein QMA93_01915, partial [Acidimicrobiales bacterium]
CRQACQRWPSFPILIVPKGPTALQARSTAIDKAVVRATFASDTSSTWFTGGVIATKNHNDWIVN